MQKILDNQLAVEWKNKQLVPLYRDLKAQIKEMSFTSEYKLIKEYLDKRTEILATFDGREQSPEA